MTELRKLIGAHWVLYKQKIEILKRQADEDSIPKYSDNIEKFRFKNKAYIYIYKYIYIYTYKNPIRAFLDCLSSCLQAFVPCVLSCIRIFSLSKFYISLHLSFAVKN